MRISDWSSDVCSSDLKGPDVQAMLDVIARHHPADIHQPLVALKEATWRLMHSYVHGGIRPVVQSLVAFPHHEAGSLLINANGKIGRASCRERVCQYV